MKMVGGYCKGSLVCNGGKHREQKQTVKEANPEEEELPKQRYKR